MNPWSLFAATFIAGVLAQVIFPRHRWGAAVFIAIVPLVILTATIWWDVWAHDALYAVGYLVGLFICSGASILSLLAVEGGRRALGK
ncbi:hypothetical protein [Sphingomonas sp. TREG-RG-20F-R18-01]|uniref:hypothetical protein n=1 Tax=Sphingomonas sp. TREG-RG-20F-R18-01 TaxID=2914982 RepID=UPI001F5A5CBE|nr:hypothetical protein [Sphingomonas sp. TREG-RG-20F-R18-01]